ncbi:MAG: winged helix DNA-binding domain-containing protein [Actinomycetota bacterium]
MLVGEIAGRRLRNSGLTGSTSQAPEDVVRCHGAMQGQDYGPTKWAIGQRCAANVVDADVDRALEAGSIIRTHVLRPTWHLVGREDVRWLLALTRPRIQRGNERRYRELGLDARLRARCERVIASALARGPMTRDEIADLLARAGIDQAGQRLPYILMHCELEAVICSGGLRGRQHTYALLDDRVPPEDPPFDREGALAELARRYLASHGPATVKDLAWWSGLTVADVTRALGELGEDVRSRKLDGLTFWMTASEPARAPAVRGVHLLHAYDELLVGFRPSRFVGDPRAEETRAAWSEPGPPRGVMLSNGRIAGLWRRTIEARALRIEMHPYERLPPGVIRALEATAARYGRFVGRPAIVSVAV